jgi:tetratricopeptide (TPR) repeat protein
LSSKKFFRKSDWIACLVTFLVSLTVYVLTLQPTVGLEDSGELVVASDYLGVPHPPGYPIWSLLTWFFQWVFHSVTYHGHPNPAWAVNLFSAVAGAAACGVLALLISRSGMDMLRSLKKESSMLGENTESLFCAAAGIAGGLLLAFGQGMWSQAVIAEVYSLNILFQSLMLLFLYRWMVDPKRGHWLILCSFIFGLGITNHQTLMFMGLALAAAILFRDLKLFRDFVITGLFFVVMVVINKFAGESDWAWASGPEKIGFWFWSAYAIIIPIIASFTLPNGKIVGPTFLVMWVGLAFYLYMPFSSDQNPPINWGYPRTWQGFMHALTRGQYERVTLANVFTQRFLQQIGAYIIDLRAQFYGPVALLAAIPFLFSPKLGKKNNTWLATTFIGFFFVSIVFMVLHNPKMDIQNQFIGRTQYIQSHALYVIWLGYGLLLGMAFLETIVKNNPVTKIGGVAMVLLLPFALVHKNYHSERQKMVVGGCEQNGHDFGWQFGNWQLQGVDGIKEDMQAFFGGTDPGRFVPTYMIYSGKVRKDVYLITQNALADNTYMNVMRDLYGDQIWIPSPLDNNMAFQQYIQGVQSGKIQAGANVKTEGGKIQVQGVAGVMQINGILSRMIFDHNQFRTETKTDEATRPTGSAVVYGDPVIDPQTGLPPQRTFYVEESYVLPWMYPYLTPHGLIMKINNKHTQLSTEMIKNDTDFWEWYCDRLLNDQKFIRDIVARKSFSKLRSALAGLYAARGKPKEAEAAFRQAVALYDLSPEANFRLADLIAKQGRFDEAIGLFDDLLAKDPNNEKALEFQNRLKKMKAISGQRTLLEQKLKSGKIEFNDAMQLISVYVQMNQANRADALAKHLLNSDTIQPQMVFQLAQHMAQARRLPIVEEALKKYTAMKPKDPMGWTNLAALQLAMNKRGEMWVSLGKAIESGGEPARGMIRKDKRFDPVRKTAEYQQLIPPLQNSGNMGLAPLPGL